MNHRISSIIGENEIVFPKSDLGINKVFCFSISLTGYYNSSPTHYNLAT